MPVLVVSNTKTAALVRAKPVDIAQTIDSCGSSVRCGDTCDADLSCEEQSKEICTDDLFKEISVSGGGGQTPLLEESPSVRTNRRVGMNVPLGMPQQA